MSSRAAALSFSDVGSIILAHSCSIRLRIFGDNHQRTLCGFNRHRRVVGHGGADVVEHRGGVGVIIRDGLGVVDAVGQRLAADQGTGTGSRAAFAALSVTGHALFCVDLRALRWGAAARGQIGAVRQDRDVPGLDVGLRPGLPSPGL
jgi:hypothetical protein